MVSEAERDAERLLRPDGPRGLPLPAFGGRSLPNVTASAVAATAPGVDRTGLLPPLEASVDPFGGRRAEGTVILGIVDGMGWGPPFVPDHRPRLDGVPEPWLRARPITTVFPTTTTVALTSLSTAAPPGRTGVVGHREYLPRFGVVAEMLRMTPLGNPHPDSLVGPTWTPAEVSGVPTIFRRGAPAVAVTRDSYEGSGFTRMLYDGAEFVPYATASDLVRVLRRLIDRASPPPLILAYWDELDTTEHLHGPDPELLEFELGQVARVLAAVRRGVAAERARTTTVLLTADHGQVTVAPEAVLRVDTEPAVLDHLQRPPAGDRRAVFFVPRPGHEGALREALSARLPDGTRFLSVDEATSGGLFGPPPFHPELRERVGEMVVVVPEPGGITYSIPGARARPPHRPGAHGGLDPAELLVPLIAGPLTDAT